MKRDYPDRPFVGVGGVVVQGERVLLVRRGKPPRQGEWSIPGGMLELGEKLRDGVSREIEEETGMTVTPLEVLDVFDSITSDADGKTQYHYVLVDYLCRVTGGVLKARDDVSRAEWVPRPALSRYNITEGTLPVIKKAFRKA